MFTAALFYKKETVGKQLKCLAVSVWLQYYGKSCNR